jgi:hypothetical protein
MTLPTPSLVSYQPRPAPVLEDSKAVYLQRELQRIRDSIVALNASLEALTTAAGVDIATKANIAGGNAFTGNQSISGTLGVTGASTLAATGVTTLTGSGAASFGSTMSVTAAVTFSSTLAVTGVSTFTDDIVANGGITMGSTLAASTTDLSRHIELYSTTYGFNVTTNRINYNVPTSAAHSFRINGSGILTIAATELTVAAAASISVGSLFLGALDDGTVNNAYLSWSTGNSMSIRTGVASTSTQGNIRGNDNVVAATIGPVGTASAATSTIITREKGDIRYQAISSERFKPDAAPIEPVDLSGLTLKGWTWGGELDESHPLFGRPGNGFIAEEVAEILPAAVNYDANGNIQGLEALALIGHIATYYNREIAALKARITELEVN